MTTALADVGARWFSTWASDTQGITGLGAAARGYRVGFIPLHWYGGDFSAATTGQLQSCLQAVYNRYHRPIWLTEYALTDFSSPAPRYPSAAEQADFVTRSTAMLNGLSFVERYAWFSLSTSTTPNASGVAYRAARLSPERRSNPCFPGGSSPSPRRSRRR